MALLRTLFFSFVVILCLPFSFLSYSDCLLILIVNYDISKHHQDFLFMMQLNSLGITGGYKRQTAMAGMEKKSPGLAGK